MKLGFINRFFLALVVTSLFSCACLVGRGRMVHSPSSSGIYLAETVDDLRTSLLSEQSSSDRPKLCFIANDTSVIAEESSFYRNGSLIGVHEVGTLSPINMERTGTFQVEKVLVEEGPCEGKRGWVLTKNLTTKSPPPF